MTIRSFLAIPLSPAAVRRLANYADTLCGFDSQRLVRWSDSDSYHLTLCFLGDITLDQVALLERQARQSLQHLCSFQLHLGQAGYLQVNPELAVLAALADSESELMQLQSRVAEMVANVGLPLDDSAFRPHVTLGRLPVGAGSDNSSAQWPLLDQLSLADSVVLYQSMPSSSGSIYTPLFDVTLPSQCHHQAASAVAERV
ncbi:MAG: RNA 2',3'-cyclic phosphodiesterase [Halopseudomonas sp.]